MKSVSLSVEDATILSRIIADRLGDCVYNSDNNQLLCPHDIAAEIETLIADPNWREPVLGDLKAAFKIQIDVAAERERLKYITPGNGQAMTYQQKVDEARAFKIASNPKTADYPVLSSEVGITAETLSEVADIVLAAFAQWQLIGAAIESIRLGAKRDIEAAADEPAARAIVDAIEWPQPAL